jgi:hypothetical protein
MSQLWPLTTVTLKATREADKVLYVTESPDEVLGLVNETRKRMMTLHRWSPSGVSEFYTRPDNVANFEDYQR